MSSTVCWEFTENKAFMTNKMRLQLMIIFIINKMPEMPITNSQSLRGPSLNCKFCPANSPKPQDIQFKMFWNTEKQQILRSMKLKLWFCHFCMINRLSKLNNVFTRWRCFQIRYIKCVCHICHSDIFLPSCLCLDRGVWLSPWRICAHSTTWQYAAPPATSSSLFMAAMVWTPLTWRERMSRWSLRES